MAISVQIPASMQSLTGGKSAIRIEAASMRELVGNIDNAFPGFSHRIIDEAGTVRKFVSIYLNDDDIRFIEGLDTPLKPGDEVWIVPPIAGG